MRRPETLAASVGGPALLALLLAPSATAQQDAPPPGRPATLPPPATAGEVEATTPTTPPGAAPGQVITPTPAVIPQPPTTAAPAATPAPLDDPERRERDRMLAESMRKRPAGTTPEIPVSIPQGYLRIAVDLDNDGTFDAVETIHAYDLLQARRMTAERQLGGPAMGGSPMGMAGGQPGMGMTGGGSGPEEFTVSGTVQDIQEFRFAGMASPYRLARIETEDGVAKVALGPADALHEINIDRGDEVTVVGHRGMINDRPVLIAREVRKDVPSATIESPDDSLLKRVRGELLSTRTVTFRDRDEEHYVAEVALRSGNVAEVILGPKQRFPDVDLEEGTMLSLLVRPARLNGRLAMAAEQVRIGDRSFAIRDQVEGAVQTDQDVEPQQASGDIAEDLANAPAASPDDRDAPGDQQAPPRDDQGPRGDDGTPAPSLRGPTGDDPES